jgi:hypothetical protein
MRVLTERLGEQPVAQLVGPSDRAQGRVQDRDPVAQALGLFEAMRGEEDRHTAAAELGDQLVHVSGGAAQHGDLVPQHEQPGVFGGR